MHVHIFFRVERVGKNGLTENETPISLDTGERVRAYATVDNRVYPPISLLTGFCFLMVVFRKEVC